MTTPRKATPPRKRVPATAPKPQDHKPKQSTEARKAEAGDGYVTLEQCGLSLRIPIGPETMPLKAYLRFKEGDEVGGTELLLGEEQWETFLAANPTVADFAAIGSAMKEAAGNR